ncbi:DUF1934 domain-containing protein [Sporosarcina sp. HYO08]|uniref:DUF1934 domain-containing protein n=1 Tax=Sporosarcina sp. HYO08 TaxID=1759557 RepID=UPI0007971BA2|nr:DUF1934 domain-containing protein [Sporosarcina sp. HYO08]KXH83937.1 hypothetical protein AU377_04070 [Sporosarcina sp. HYO08]
METKHQERNVTIQLHSLIRHPGQAEEKHFIQADGAIIDKKGKKYLVYEESMDGQNTRTMIKLDHLDAFIMRNGSVTMRLPFNEKNETNGSYGNGPTSFPLNVRTKKLEFTEEQDGANGQFHVQYGLYANEEKLGTYELTITYTEGTK